MLTKRALLLTLTGLLTSYLAAGQSTASAGPTPTTILSWVVWWAVGIVLLMGVVTAGAITSASRYRREAQAATPMAPALPAEQSFHRIRQGEAA